LYEGTRVTKNVKQPTGSPAYRRAWIAFCAVVLVGLGVGAGCSTDCSGPDCEPCRGADCEPCSGPDCEPCRGADCTSGRFSACKASSECDELHGFACVEGECSYACRSHQDCKEVGHCDVRDVDGERKTFCVRDTVAPAPGQLYTNCPSGDECAEGYLCVGAGAGDLDAYCTTDCQSDDACAPGFYCGSITRPPCEDACGFAGQKTDARCVPSSQIGAGQPYQCGEFGIVRSVCRQREFCAACETHADCLGVPNQVCARDESGQKICTKLCDTNIGSCPWGNAARCATFDSELGVPTCSHRFKSCQGTGQTCEPCHTNQDCPGGVCQSSDFTGERWCVNLATQCECPNGPDRTGTCADGGCPDSPSGLTLLCIGEERSSLFNICYAANSSGGSLLGSSSPQTGCWEAP